MVDEITRRRSGRRGAFGNLPKVEMNQNFFDDCRILEEADDGHRPLTLWPDERIGFVNLLDGLPSSLPVPLSPPWGSCARPLSGSVDDSLAADSRGCCSRPPMGAASRRSCDGARAADYLASQHFSDRAYNFFADAEVAVWLVDPQRGTRHDGSRVMSVCHQRHGIAAPVYDRDGAPRGHLRAPCRMRARTMAESAGVSARSVARSASSFAVPIAAIALPVGRGSAAPSEPARDSRVPDELPVAAVEVAVAVVGGVDAVEVLDAEAHEPALHD